VKPNTSAACQRLRVAPGRLGLVLHPTLIGIPFVPLGSNIHKLAVNLPVSEP
jgi:hypothetical protein